jgi:hypothetical protein
MKTAEHSISWVVYLMTLHNLDGVKAVCEQREWDEMERVRPGYHTLIRSGIANEAEAEKLARGTSGDPIKPRPRGEALARAAIDPTLRGD